MPQDGGQVALGRSVDPPAVGLLVGGGPAARLRLLPLCHPPSHSPPGPVLTTGEAVCPRASVHVSCLPAPHPITQTLEEGARAMPSLRPDAIPVASTCPSQVLGTSSCKGSSSSGLTATMGSSFLVFRFMDGRVRPGQELQARRGSTQPPWVSATPKYRSSGDLAWGQNAFPLGET